MLKDSTTSTRGLSRKQVDRAFPLHICRAGLPYLIEQPSYQTFSVFPKSCCEIYIRHTWWRIFHNHYCNIEIIMSWFVYSYHFTSIILHTKFIAYHFYEPIWNTILWYHNVVPSSINTVFSIYNATTWILFKLYKSSTTYPVIVCSCVSFQ